MPDKKQSLGLIGVGAFGGFAVQHLAAHFDLVLHDATDVSALAREHGARLGDLPTAAGCDVVVLAVPVQLFETVLRSIAPLLKQDALFIDVGSIKIGPAKLAEAILPTGVSIVGTHPLFGPQSGKNSIDGLNIAVCPVRGDRADCVSQFLSEKLKLNVMRSTPEEHDRELAWVQGLTHLLAKVIVSLDLPEFRFTTRTFDYMMKMVEMVRHDSEELFRAIERENPFSSEAKKAFFVAARKLEDDLNRD